LAGEEREKSLLKVGKIPYTNLFPIFYALQREYDCSRYEFVEGVPSAVNRLLRSGEIDISPSSSIEYLRYGNQYNLIEGHSISSKGPAGSIFLLSRRPIEQLVGKTILVSSQSDTSVALLDIVLRKFYEIVCCLEPTDESVDSMIEKADALLVIGDEALKAAKKVTNYKTRQTPSLTSARVDSDLTLRGGGQGWEGNAGTPSRKSEILNIYDLGELWYKNRGLPFVFALWIARKDCYAEKAELLHGFVHDLQEAKISALQNLNRIARELRPSLLERYSLNITEEELVSYWNGISYDLTEEHKKGLELFRKYSEELGLL
jgi:chorismate dehydratase